MISLWLHRVSVGLSVCLSLRTAVEPFNTLTFCKILIKKYVQLTITKLWGWNMYLDVTGQTEVHFAWRL